MDDRLSDDPAASMPVRKHAPGRWRDRPRQDGAPAQTPRKPSLKSRLARHVTVPLIVTWAIGAIVTAAVANHFTQQAFDRSLLDDAYLLASHVAPRDGRLALSLSSTDMSTLLFNPSETEFFAVLAPGGALIAGHAGLRPRSEGGPAVEFADIHYRNRRLRGVTLRLGAPAAFSVVVAETTATRRELLTRLLTYSIAAQLLLLLALTWWLHRAIRSDLEPLDALQHALDQRDASDLAPVSPALIDGARSRDIERLGLAVNALLARVGGSIRAQQEFAGNVAHELRTPLAGIRALAEYGLAQRRPAVWREQLQAIVASQARASHLIDQLLALALADEAAGSLALAPVSLDRVARDALLQFLPRADAAGVDLGASGLESRVEVEAHPALVEGLLNNLLDNALRYGGGVPLRRAVVTLELARHGAWVRLSVIDNGPGLAGPQRQRMTQRWVQGPTGERLGEGAGLGLAIVARYAELMHARFELADGPDGQGLRASVVFAAVLPAAAAEAPD